MHSNKSDNFQNQNESIPKMQLNMFIQKDAKQSGGKKWPKVETPFCRQNKIAEVDNHNGQISSFYNRFYLSTYKIITFRRREVQPSN